MFYLDDELNPNSDNNENISDNSSSDNLSSSLDSDENFDNIDFSEIDDWLFDSDFDTNVAAVRCTLIEDPYYCTQYHMCKADR